MPPIFKALASITAWSLWILSWVVGLSTFVMGLVTGTLYGSAPVPNGIPRILWRFPCLRRFGSSCHEITAEDGITLSCQSFQKRKSGDIRTLYQRNRLVPLCLMVCTTVRTRVKVDRFRLPTCREGLL